MSGQIAIGSAGGVRTESNCCCARDDDDAHDDARLHMLRQPASTTALAAHVGVDGRERYAAVRATVPWIRPVSDPALSLTLNPALSWGHVLSWRSLSGIIMTNRSYRRPPYCRDRSLSVHRRRRRRRSHYHHRLAQISPPTICLSIPCKPHKGPALFLEQLFGCCFTIPPPTEFAFRKSLQSTCGTS